MARLPALTAPVAHGQQAQQSAGGKKTSKIIREPEVFVSQRTSSFLLKLGRIAVKELHISIFFCYTMLNGNYRL